MRCISSAMFARNAASSRAAVRSSSPATRAAVPRPGSSAPVAFETCASRLRSRATSSECMAPESSLERRSACAASKWERGSCGRRRTAWFARSCALSASGAVETAPRSASKSFGSAAWTARNNACARPGSLRSNRRASAPSRRGSFGKSRSAASSARPAVSGSPRSRERSATCTAWATRRLSSDRCSSSVSFRSRIRPSISCSTAASSPARRSVPASSSCAPRVADAARAIAARITVIALRESPSRDQATAMRACSSGASETCRSKVARPVASRRATSSGIASSISRRRRSSRMAGSLSPRSRCSTARAWAGRPSATRSRAWVACVSGSCGASRNSSATSGCASLVAPSSKRRFARSCTTQMSDASSARACTSCFLACSTEPAVRLLAASARRISANCGRTERWRQCR